jgi:hypothetical protein
MIMNISTVLSILAFRFTTMHYNAILYNAITVIFGLCFHLVVAIAFAIGNHPHSPSYLKNICQLYEIIIRSRKHTASFFRA